MNCYIVKRIFIALLLVSFIFAACSAKKEMKEEQIRINSSEVDSIKSLIQGEVPLGKIATKPNSIILTGMAEHRLVTVYKTRKSIDSNSGQYKNNGFRHYKDSEAYSGEWVEHFMPGIDILYGYNLLNLAHYDLKLEKLNFLFDKAVLIKTLYYPSFIQDSLHKKPINRNYYLVSVYDEDTNKDTLINNKDLRRFYHFDASCNTKIQLLPNDYSVVRSQYDSQNDVMYLYAIQDANKNGTRDEDEPLHVFWVNLKSPTQAKRLY